MKHYKDKDNNLFGYEEEKEIPEGLIEITIEESQVIGKLNFEKEFESKIASMDYVRQRINFYPEIGEFVDAWVKDDQKALEEYRQKCLAVKQKYPKPDGF